MEHAAVPDQHGALEAAVAEGDLVVLRCAFTGTHRGEFRLQVQGEAVVIQATGQAITTQRQVMYQVEQGRIVQRWLGMNLLDFFLQLGATLAVPAPARR
jgi:predicted ester cyclase